MKYIDVHTHVFPQNIAAKAVAQLEGYYGFKWSGNGEEADLVASHIEAGITKSVIFSSATKAAQVRSINNYIASLQNTYPHLFYGFGTLHQEFEDYAGEIDRMISLGLHGLKFHPDFQGLYVDEPRMMKIYEAVGDFFPVLFHIGDHRTQFSKPERLMRVHKAFPKLKIIAAHMGGYSEWQEAWKHIIGQDVYVDISSTIPFIGVEETRKMVLAHGVERVLFASDYPARRQKQAVEDVLSLDLGEKANGMIFHENAEKLMGIKI